MRQFNGSVCLEKVQWQRLVLILALLPALLALNSCGKGSASAATSTPTLTISCNPTSVTVNGTATCTQSITNLSSTLVNWQAGGVVGGNSTFGTIDTNGKYTAPQTVPTSNVVTITAIAQAQTSLTATATITILPATAISAITCLDANSAPSLTVKSGTSLACTATSSANTTIPVFWQVNTIPGGNAAIGKINAQGNYVAPLVPAAGGTVTITAISQAVSTQTMSVTVNVTFGNRVLSGSYAFSASGQLQATNGFFSRVGSFIADGNGGLTGLEDVNPQPAIVTSEPISFSGSYSIGPDGRGTMQFCEPASGNACAVPTSLFRVVVISPQQAQIIDFQTSSAASGEIVAQPDISVFKTGGLIGGYTFSFSGISSGTTEESVVGEFVSDGAGKITSGELDTNIGGTPTSQVAILNTSTYTIDSRGRGTAKLITSGGTSNFDFYMVSASRAKFLQTDASPVLAGDSFKQQSINPWAPSSLNGNLVLQASGTNSAGAFLADVGTFATDGSGTITAGSGLLDQNSGGAVTSPPPYGGTYTVDLLGRGTITIPNHTYVLYMISAGNAVLQETTGSTVAHGILTQPQGSPSLNGNYGLALAGQNASKQEEDIVGQLSVNSTGNVTAAALDINNFGALTTGQTAIGTYTTVVGGRTTVLLNPTRNLVLYFVSPTQAYALDTDTTGAAIGSLDKQF